MNHIRRTNSNHYVSHTSIISRDGYGERIDYLKSLIKRKQEAIKIAPRGFLRISKSKSRTQYYHRMDNKDKNGIYLKKSEKGRIVSLAQKEYDRRVLKAAEEELKVLERFGRQYPLHIAEEQYELMSEGWRELVHPIIETDAQFVARWLSVEYPPSKVEGKKEEFVTERGEYVRSKSEVLIANYLYRHKIPYRYEYPINLKRIGTVHPDFIILNVRLRKEIIWEHLGRMDKEDYARDNVYRLNCYQATGYFLGDNLIVTMETNDLPINLNIVKEMVNRYCL